MGSIANKNLSHDHHSTNDFKNGYSKNDSIDN